MFENGDRVYVTPGTPYWAGGYYNGMWGTVVWSHERFTGIRPDGMRNDKLTITVDTEPLIKGSKCTDIAVLTV